MQHLLSFRSPIPIILLLHDSGNSLAIAIYPEILGVEFFTLHYLIVVNFELLQLCLKEGLLTT